jgi:hypothetical protein
VEILKCCLHLFLNLRKIMVTYILQSFYFLEIRPSWQRTWMQSTQCGTVSFQAHQVWSCRSYLLILTSKSQLHNVLHNCTPDGRYDFLDMVANQNVRLSEVIVVDILDLDHLPIMFTILDPVRAKEGFDSVWQTAKISLYPFGSERLPMFFRMLGQVRTVNPSDRVDKSSNIKKTILSQCL